MLRLVCGVLWVQLESLHPQTHFSSDYKRQNDMLNAVWNNFWTPVGYGRKYFFSKAVQSEATQSSTKQYTIPRCSHFQEKELAPLLGTTMSFSGLGLSYSYKNTEHIGIDKLWSVTAKLSYNGQRDADLRGVTLYISVSQPLWDRGPVNSFFIRRGPGPKKLTRKYLSIFF